MGLLKWLKLITVEPAMFLQQAGDTLTYVIFQNLFIDKICTTDLGYNAGICDLYAKINTNNLTKEEEVLRPMMNDIQTASSEFLLINSLVENSFPVLLVLFLGVWSDRERRRKPPLLLCLVGKMLRSFGLLLNSYFIGWPTFLLLITVSLPHSLGGGNAVFHMASFSYIADASVPRSRTWRLGVAEIFWQLGAPIGMFFGAYLFELGGYLYVFGTSSACHLIAVLYTAFVLPEVPPPKPQQKLIFGKHGNYGTYTDVPKRIRYYSEHDVEKDLHPSKGHGHKKDLFPASVSIPASVPEAEAEPRPSSVEEDNNNAKNKNQVQNPQKNQYLTIPGNSKIPEETVDNSGSSSEDDDEDDDHHAHKGSNSVKEFIVGSIQAILRPRPNHTRKCLLSIGAIMLLYGICFYGEHNMRYLFTRNKFQWREVQFSNWTTFDSLMVVTGLVVVMPIFSKLFKFSDPFAGVLAAFMRVSSRLCFALAPESSYFYYGSLMEIPGVIGPLSARSLASKCVLRDERGRVFAFLGCIEAIVPLLAVPLYSAIYTATFTVTPSAIYFLSTSIYFTILLIFGVLFIALKLKIVEFSGNDLTSLLGPSKGRNARAQERRASRVHLASSLYRRSSLS